MNFKTVIPSLNHLDELTQDSLVLSFFCDERPLSGVSGLIDWRLNGYLSRMLLERRLGGDWGEQVLFPQNGRVTFKNIILFGLGERAHFDSSRFKEVTNKMLQTLMQMQCTSFATVLPGQQVLNLAPRQLIDLWLGELQNVFVVNDYHIHDANIAFLASYEEQSEIGEQLATFTQQLLRR